MNRKSSEWTEFLQKQKEAIESLSWVPQRIGAKDSKKVKIKVSAYERAIKNIDTGSYGICENCGQEVSIPRLEAVPCISVCECCSKEQEKVTGVYYLQEYLDHKEDNRIGKI